MEKNHDYDVFVNNCADESWKALIEGNLYDGTSVKDFILERTANVANGYGYKSPSVIPNVNQAKMEVLFRNNSFTKEDYISTLERQLIETQKKYDDLNWFTRFFYGSYYSREIESIKKQLSGDCK